MNFRKGRVLLSCLWLLLLPLAGQAQKRFSLEPEISYGTFRMGPMKAFQQEIISDIGVNAQATDAFPAFFIYGLKLGYSSQGLHRVGVLLRRGSSGGRVAYEDYSGSFTADQLVRFTGLGLFVEDKSRPEFLAPFHFLMGAEASMFFNSLVLDNRIKVFNQQANEKEAFNSLGVAVHPYVGVSYPYKKVEVKLMIGYLYNINGQFHVKGNKDLLLDNKIKVDWSGLRIMASISF